MALYQNSMFSDFTQLYLCNKKTIEQLACFPGIHSSSFLLMCSKCNMILQLWQSSGDRWTDGQTHAHVHTEDYTKPSTYALRLITCRLTIPLSRYSILALSISLVASALFAFV